MSEPLRTDPADLAPLSEADRAARIEQLLLSGLDHYFGGQYEQAINIWTRVAFLERGHGRARAYIERARGALAERQRESEELLHNGVAAYEAGDLQTARELLTRAVEQGGASDTALSSGQTVDATTIVLKYTYAGDANLDGTLNGDDYFRIDQGYASHLTGYANGDFNYDNKINADDYFLLDRNYARKTVIFASSLPAEDLSVAAVPEPTAPALALITAAAGLNTRTRRRRG